MSDQEDLFDESDDDWEEMMDNSCPNCGEEYDEIDYEYQICHLCGHNANPTNP